MSKKYVRTKIKKDYTGVKRKHLTGIKYLYSIKYRAFWQWRCVCGNLIVRNTGSIPESCGCENVKRLKKQAENRILPNNQSFKNKLFERYKKDAIRRNLIFKLSRNQFETFLDKDCHYCGSPPSNEMLTTLVENKNNSRTFKHSGIDRCINSIGYILNNCVPCCFICNKMKMTLDYGTFINHISKIKTNIETNSNIQGKF